MRLNTNTLPSQKRLRELFNYDPETGIVTRRMAVSVKCRAGDVVGHREARGYVHTTVDWRPIRLHQLIWIYVHGRIDGEIDHVNGDKSDNRLSNLRPANRSQNMSNKPLDRRNKSGFKGVHWSKKDRCWVAQIQVNRKTIHLGSFGEARAAAAVYAEAAKQHFGEFVRAA